MAFIPIEALNSCVINSIAFIAGYEEVPEDWMTDLDNLHNLDQIQHSLQSWGLEHGPVGDFITPDDIMEDPGSCANFVDLVKVALESCGATFGIILVYWTNGNGHAMVVESEPF